MLLSRVNIRYLSCVPAENLLEIFEQSATSLGWKPDDSLRSDQVFDVGCYVTGFLHGETLRYYGYSNSNRIIHGAAFRMENEEKTIHTVQFLSIESKNHEDGRMEHICEFLMKIEGGPDPFSYPLWSEIGSENETLRELFREFAEGVPL